MAYDKQRCCCKCESWGKEGERGLWRVCSTLYISCGRVYRCKVITGEPLTTPDHFSCGEFKEKPKGPFSLIESLGVDVWTIFFERTHDSIRILQGTRERMDEIAALLNEQWTITKGKGKEE